MVGPLTIDTSLPAFNKIATFLGVEMSSVEFSMSLFFFGFGLGQFSAGLLGDLKGRKRVISWGLVITFLASIGLVFSQEIYSFYGFRFLQAIGGGFVGVSIAATVRDYFKGDQAARVMSNIMMIAMSAPLIAPSLGAFILKVSTWQYIFVFIALYAVLMYIIVQRRLELIIDEHSEKLGLGRRLGIVFSNIEALKYMITMSVASGALYTYLTTSAFIYTDYYGFSPATFAILFGLNGGILILLNKVNAILVGRFKTRNLLKFGLFLHGSSLAVILLLMINNYDNPYVILVLLCLHIGSLGFISGNGTALALSCYEARFAGLVNSLMRVSGILFGSLVGFISTSLNDGTLFPPIGVMFVCSVLGSSCYFLLARKMKKQA
jgi:DHA1 family bicyclomycin/chloramphenicol resistance-like MFS transporter